MSLYTHIIPLAFIETLILVKASVFREKNITSLILVKVLMPSLIIFAQCFNSTANCKVSFMLDFYYLDTI